jgi:hypothetical protein
VLTWKIMSLRTNAPPAAPQNATATLARPGEFKFSVPDTPISQSADNADAPLSWSDLSETEKSAASLGVQPDSWKPIGFMNTSHYDTLLKANAIDADLARKLEAYRHVSVGGK